MEQKEIKINCPEGFEVDKENSTFECIKFKPIKNKLPKTWEEYCKTHPRRKGESWINEIGRIINVEEFAKSDRHCLADRNLLPSKEYAEAMLALCQLIQLRDCYNDGWTPNWTDTSQEKYCLYVSANKVLIDSFRHANCILAFKTGELCDQFFENFKDLIEIAKPLI